MSLPKYYSRKPLRPNADAKDVRERLNEIDPEQMAFVSLGETTNEELLSLRELARDIGCKNLDSGFGKFFNAIPADFHEVLRVGFPFKHIENASKIVLLLDPFVQYPLLARYILRAREKGAEVLEVGFAGNERYIADETILVRSWDEIMGAEESFEDAVVICDLNPWTTVEMLSTVLRVSKRSELLLMKPFLNATGALMLNYMSDVLMNEKIRALYVLESDLIDIAINEPEMENWLSKLDLLIVHNAYESRITKLADITLQSDPFYEKKGTIVNAEGRILETGGCSTRGIELIEKMGGMGYKESHERVLNELEDERGTKKEGEIDIEPKEIPESEGALLVYKTNPFFWHGIRHKNFIDMSVDNVRDMGLNREDNIKVICDGEEEVGFKPVESPRDIFVSEIKLPACKDLISHVRVTSSS